MDGTGQREFGRRRAARLSNGRPASRSTISSSLAKWFAAVLPTPPNSDSVVPTKLLPILQAAIAMLIVQLLLSFLIIGPPPSSPLRVPEIGSDTFTAFFLPWLLALCWNVAHFAAIYTMLAHATLRWIGFSGPKAYALGGLRRRLCADGRQRPAGRASDLERNNHRVGWRARRRLPLPTNGRPGAANAGVRSASQIRTRARRVGGFGRRRN